MLTSTASSCRLSLSWIIRPDLSTCSAKFSPAVADSWKMASNVSGLDRSNDGSRKILETPAVVDDNDGGTAAAACKR